jgi:hypothetical protein
MSSKVPTIGKASTTCTSNACSIALSPWCSPKIVPSQTYQTGLKVYNSLTRRNDEFITMNGDRHITWYMYVTF